MKLKIALAAAVASLAVAAPAQAAPYLFTLTGDYAASWTMDSEQTPDSSLWYRARYSNVTGTFQGLAGSSVTLDFYTDAGWGFSISDNGNGNVLADPYDPNNQITLFDGPASAPVFKAGTYSFLNNRNNNPVTLVISAVNGAVPEPATWALMIAGFGAIGFTMRRRNASTTVRYA